MVQVMEFLLKHVETGRYGVITCSECGDIMERRSPKRPTKVRCAMSAFADGWRVGPCGAVCGECNRRARGWAEGAQA